MVLRNIDYNVSQIDFTCWLRAVGCKEFAVDNSSRERTFLSCPCFIAIGERNPLLASKTLRFIKPIIVSIQSNLAEFYRMIRLLFIKVKKLTSCGVMPSGNKSTFFGSK